MILLVVGALAGILLGFADFRILVLTTQKALGKDRERAIALIRLSAAARLLGAFIALYAGVMILGGTPFMLMAVAFIATRSIMLIVSAKKARRGSMR
ncbi:MAG TPA: hypothetical protein GXX51_03260 [Firmicutes bacterium]|nr:hypothetical protein [Bacillota bacterium]